VAEKSQFDVAAEEFKSLDALVRELNFRDDGFNP
jgi:hypothetical protein